MYSVKPVLTRFEDMVLSQSMYPMKSTEMIVNDDGGLSTKDDFLDRLSKQVEFILRQVNPTITNRIRVISDSL